MSSLSTSLEQSPWFLLQKTKISVWWPSNQCPAESRSSESERVVSRRRLSMAKQGSLSLPRLRSMNSKPLSKASISREHTPCETRASLARSSFLSNISRKESERNFYKSPAFKYVQKFFPLRSSVLAQDRESYRGLAGDGDYMDETPENGRLQETYNHLSQSLRSYRGCDYLEALHSSPHTVAPIERMWGWDYHPRFHTEPIPPPGAGRSRKSCPCPRRTKDTD